MTVEKNIVSTNYIICLSNLPGWNEEHEENIDNGESGEILHDELKHIGCDGVLFGGLGYCTFRITPSDDTTITWQKIEKAFKKYFALLSACSNLNRI